MRIGKFKVSAELMNDADFQELFNRLNIKSKEFVHWSNMWEVVAISDIFPDVPRYDNDPIPSYEISIHYEGKERSFRMV